MNTMCLNCVNLGEKCPGEKKDIYSGCIYKVMPCGKNFDCNGCTSKCNLKNSFIFPAFNPLCTLNHKINAKFCRLSYADQNFIFVGILPGKYSKTDYADIMSYFRCVGYAEISKEQAANNSNLPVENFQYFLKLVKGA